MSAFHARYAGGGPRNQPFHPAMMGKVWMYCYATGVFSSRKLAKKLHEDVALRVRQPVVHRRWKQIVHATSDGFEAAHGNTFNWLIRNPNYIGLQYKLLVAREFLIPEV